MGEQSSGGRKSTRRKVTGWRVSHLLMVTPPVILILISHSLFSLSQGCDLPEQSTVHVVLPPSGSSSSRLLLLQERLTRGGQEEQDSLTRLDLSSSRLPATSTGLAVILKGSEGGGGGDGETEEAREEAQAAGLKGQHVSTPAVRQCSRSMSLVVL